MANHIKCIGIFFLVVCIAFKAEATKEETLIIQKPKPKGDFQELIIPIRSSKNLILVEAEVDGQIGFFILDTGAPYLVLNKVYFRNYKEKPNQVATGVGGVQSSRLVTSVDKLKIRDLYYENLKADLTDLSHIENRRGLKILGLLGVNLFLELELRIDLTQLSMTVYKLDKQGNHVAEKEGVQKAENQNKIVFDLIGQTMMIPAKVNGQSLNFCFDTGAESVVLNNNLNSAVWERIKITGRKQLMGAEGSNGEVLYGYIKGLDVGRLFAFAQIAITNLDDLGNAFGVQLDGMIGYDLLNAAITEINFVKKTIIIQY